MQIFCIADQKKKRDVLKSLLSERLTGLTGLTMDCSIKQLGGGDADAAFNSDAKVLDLAAVGGGEGGGGEVDL